MAKDSTRPIAPLIYERATVCELGDDLSIATVIRAENNGLLTPLKPSGKPNGKTYYAADEVRQYLLRRIAPATKVAPARRVRNRERASAEA